MCYQSVCYSASSIVDFECQDIIVKQLLLAIVITKPLITIVAALFRSGSLEEFDLKSGKAQKEISILFIQFSQIAVRKLKSGKAQKEISIFFSFCNRSENCIEKEV